MAAVLCVAACLACAMGAAGPVGCGSSAAEQASQSASKDTFQTLRPQFDALLRPHPERAAAVADLEAHWAERTERANYLLAVPLLKLREQDAPDLSDAIEAKLWSWDARLTKFGQ